MIRAFVDASVLYAAIISSTGASRELLKQHIGAQIQLLVSEYVLDEVENNLQAKSPASVAAVRLLVDVLNFEVVEVDTNMVMEVAEYTELKDAPIVAAALVSNCRSLLTFDRKHLLDQPQIAEKSGVEVMIPGDLLQILRNVE